MSVCRVHKSCVLRAYSTTYDGTDSVPAYCSLSIVIYKKHISPWGYFRPGWEVEWSSSGSLKRRTRFKNSLSQKYCAIYPTQVSGLSIKCLFLSMVMDKTVWKHGVDVSLCYEGVEPADDIPLWGPCVQIIWNGGGVGGAGMGDAGGATLVTRWTHVTLCCGQASPSKPLPVTTVRNMWHLWTERVGGKKNCETQVSGGRKRQPTKQLQWEIQTQAISVLDCISARWLLYIHVVQNIDSQ